MINLPTTLDDSVYLIFDPLSGSTRDLINPADYDPMHAINIAIHFINGRTQKVVCLGRTETWPGNPEVYVLDKGLAKTLDRAAYTGKILLPKMACGDVILAAEAFLEAESDLLEGFVKVYNQTYEKTPLDFARVETDKGAHRYLQANLIHRYGAEKWLSLDMASEYAHLSLLDYTRDSGRQYGRIISVLWGENDDVSIDCFAQSTTGYIDMFVLRGTQTRLATPVKNHEFRIDRETLNHVAEIEQLRRESFSFGHFLALLFGPRGGTYNIVASCRIRGA